MSRDSWLKRLIWLRGSPAGGSGASYEKTVGPAPIISISDAKAKPAKSLVVCMEPIQDLHGYDSPWPAGGGKNLFDIDNPVFTAASISIKNSFASKVENGKLYNGGAVGRASGSGITIPAETGDYTISFVSDGENVRTEVRAVTIDSDGIWTSNTYIYTDSSASGSTGYKSITVSFPSGYTHLYFTAYSDIQYGSWETAVQIEKGSSASSWSPYSNICPISGRTGLNVYHSGEDTSNPAIYPISWQTEAGTVYGGTVDVVSGLLTVTHGFVTLDGTQTGVLYNWRTSETSTGWLYPWSLTQNKIYPVYTDIQGIKSDMLPFATFQNAYSESVDLCVTTVTTPNGVSDWGIAVRYPDLTLTTVTAVNAFLAANPITVCYELATPQTYQLTPQQIQMLKGSNTLWSDADDLTLTYIGTTPPNLLGGGYNPPAEQDPEELTEPEATETDEPTKETPAEEGENNGE